MTGEDDLYEMLQVHPNAQVEVIQAAYRRLMRLYHPDVNQAPGANEFTRRLNEAYEILSDPARRNQYDRPRSFGYRPYLLVIPGPHRIEGMKLLGQPSHLLPDLHDPSQLHPPQRKQDVLGYQELKAL